MKIFSKKAVSAIEYAVLLVIIMMALLFMQKYIVRAMAGRWKAVGESFSAGRQYDPRATTECAWFSSPQLNQWYNPQCFDQFWADNYYSNYVNNCVRQCRVRGDVTPCSAAPPTTCCHNTRYGIRCSSVCCETECKRRCSDTTAAAGVAACQTVGGVPCN